MKLFFLTFLKPLKINNIPQHVVVWIKNKSLKYFLTSKKLNTKLHYATLKGEKRK
jgi:hypothetical protein